MRLVREGACERAAVTLPARRGRDDESRELGLAFLVILPDLAVADDPGAVDECEGDDVRIGVPAGEVIERRHMVERRPR
jgi:hypothetical protein